MTTPLAAGTNVSDIPRWDGTDWVSTTEVINVKTKGATGNGTDDDTTAVQAAITAAAASPGAIVFFPPGTYICSPLTLPKGTVLQGVNSHGYASTGGNTMSTVKLKAGSTGSLIEPNDTGTDSTHVHIRDLCLHGNAINYPVINLPDDVSAGAGRFWYIDRVYVNPAQTAVTGSGSAVYIGGNMNGVLMRDCIVSNAATVSYGAQAGYYGIRNEGNDNFFENCWVSSFGIYDWFLGGGSSSMTSYIRGGGCFWSGFANIGVAGYGYTISDVSIDHSLGYGVYATKSCSIIGCNFYSNSYTTDNAAANIEIPSNDVKLTLIGNVQKYDGGNHPSHFVHKGSTTGVVLNMRGNINVNETYGTAYTDWNYQVTAPSFPATTVTVTNTTGADITAYIANGNSAITVVTVGGVTTGLQIAANGWGTVPIPQGQSFACTYTGTAPTWTWFAG